MGDEVKSDKSAWGKSGLGLPLVLRFKMPIILGIEIDPTAGVKTATNFWLGSTSILKKVEDSEVKNEGKLHFTTVSSEFMYQKKLGVKVEPRKSGLLKSYDKNTGNTTFRKNPYPTAGLNAEIYVFRSNSCLIGAKSFEDIKSEMNKTIAGLNRILIRLDKKGEKLLDCIIDGVVYFEGGEKKV